MPQDKQRTLPTASAPTEPHGTHGFRLQSDASFTALRGAGGKRVGTGLPGLDSRFRCVASRKLWLIDLRKLRKIHLEDVKSLPTPLRTANRKLMSSVSVVLVPYQVNMSWVTSALAWILHARSPNRIPSTGSSEA
jgi:hypothetical protein